MADDRLDEAMIQKAIRLARKGEGYTSPNPMVGAVIYDDGGIIATGFHTRAGDRHAERVALARAGDRARGATLAVNLEPCCHYGRTGPCTDAIIAAGIKRVVFSIIDPFPQVNGNGERILSEHGIELVDGIARDEAMRLNEVYLKFVATGRPFVVLKLAQSLDGRIATQTGQSRWLTSDKARTFAHALRARYDAVVVGAGTIRVDNPQLTVRHVKGKNPRRIVVTTSPNLSTRSHVFSGNSDGNTVVATTREVIGRGAYSAVTTWAIRSRGGRLDLGNLLERAASEGMTSILVEGGNQLATSLLKAKLVDKLYLFLAPMIIGAGKDAVGDLSVRRLTDAVKFKEYGFKKLGQDMLFWGYPEA